MGIRQSYDRDVIFVPRVVSGTDARGNEVIVDGTPIPGVRAMRQLRGADEDLDTRDQQREVWTYYLSPFSETGTPVPVAESGRARIVDGADTLEVEGRIRVAVRRRRNVVHHLEADAYRIEG